MRTFRGVRGGVPSLRSLSTAASWASLPNVNYAEYILSHVARHAHETPRKAAMTCGSTGRITLYSEVAARFAAARRGFIAAGVSRGTVVCLHLPNSPEFIVAFNALASLAAVITTSNPLYSPSELAHQLKDAGAVRIVTVPPLEAAARAAAAEAGLPASAVLVLGSPAAAFLLEDCSAAALALARGGSGLVETVEVAPVDAQRDLLALPYSSGTTGLPKGVALSHRNLTSNLEQLASTGEDGMGMTAADVVLGVLPLYHIYGITCIMGLPLRIGSSLVTLPRFDPAAFLGAIAGHRMSFLYVVPPIMAFLAKHPSVLAADTSSVLNIFSGAAPLDAELQRAVEARMPQAVVRQGYGMTESSPVTHVARKRSAQAPKPGSVGSPLVHTRCRVLDVTSGKELPPGAANVGELQLAGPQIMLGYFKNAAATAATLVAGADGEVWLRTGDLGYVDADGDYFIVDRLKELIKCKGFQVAPAELEGILMSHPLVYDAAVVPRADERAGELPVAFVVTKATLLSSMGNAKGAAALPPVSAADIKAFVASKVAEYKRITDVVFVDTIPKSAAGKILRRVLRDKIVADDAAAKRAAAAATK